MTEMSSTAMPRCPLLNPFLHNSSQGADTFYEDALNSYNITLFNQHSISYELGMCYIENGDYENAIKCFDKLKKLADVFNY